MGRRRHNTEPKRKKFSPLREFPSEEPMDMHTDADAPIAFAAHPTENMCPMMMPITFQLPYGVSSSNSSKDSDIESNAEIASMTAAKSRSPEMTMAEACKVKESYKVKDSSEESDYLYD